MRYMIMGVLLGVIGFITACGGGSGTGTTTTESVTPAPETTEVTEPAVELPALADLPRAATGTAVTSLNGADYSDDLLHFRVERSDNTAIYTPTGTTLAESALATYCFNLTGVTDDQDLLLYYGNDWGFTAEPRCCWVALADWSRNTWNWFAMDERDRLRIGDPTPYAHPEDGTCYLIMLYQGDREIRLDILGFETVPDYTPVIVSVEPQRVITGMTAGFTARVEGSGPLSYAWNFGGGATPNTSTDLQPSVTAGAPGNYNCSLAVSNDSGTTEYTFALVVITDPGEWVHTNSVAPHDDCYFGSNRWAGRESLTQDRHGNVYYFAQQNYYDGMQLTLRELNVIKVSPAGDLVWSYNYDLEMFPESDFDQFDTKSIWTDGDNIYLTGQVPAADPSDSPPYFIIKIGQDGTPLWARSFVGYYYGLSGICDSDQNVYLAYSVPMEPDFPGLPCSILVKLSPSGEFIRKTTWGGPIEMEYGLYSGGGKAYGVAIDDSDNLYVTGRHEQWFSVGLSIVKITPQGTITDEAYVTPGSTNPAARVIVSGNGDYVYISIAGGMIAFSDSLDYRWAKLYKIDENDTLTRPWVCRPDGSLLMCGEGTTIVTQSGPNTVFPVILNVLADGSVSWSRRWDNGDEWSGFSDMTTLPDGSTLILGNASCRNGSWRDITSETSIIHLEDEDPPVRFRVVEIARPDPEFTEVECSRSFRDYQVDATADYEQHLLIRTTL